jgi:hypothetical protein
MSDHDRRGGAIYDVTVHYRRVDDSTGYLNVSTRHDRRTALVDVRAAIDAELGTDHDADRGADPVGAADLTGPDDHAAEAAGTVASLRAAYIDASARDLVSLGADYHERRGIAARLVAALDAGEHGPG